MDPLAAETGGGVSARGGSGARQALVLLRQVWSWANKHRYQDKAVHVVPRGV